ncbi:hypothetical protein U14_02309 [Candidatus Moduliflexus flocculans]|uniref:Uncharacterized protein n=1 Tax=Candidatus Moduliflexus flocculans TaxID=1499966 RepID=A0A0S6VU26_9BACT|nr:hypothetical protein U14_02309 [Candidatus Moduliflexus flocculans]
MNRQEIHRNREDAKIAQNRRQAEIDARIAAVIDAADNHDGALLLTQAFQNFFAAFHQRAAERFLRPIRHFQRAFNLFRRFAERLRKFDQRIQQRLLSLRKRHDRAQKLVFRQIQRGVDQIRCGLHVWAKMEIFIIRIILFHADNAGEKDVIHIVPL